MPVESIGIRSIDLHTAADAEYADLNALRNALRHEALPEDPPWPVEEDKRRLQARNPAKDDTAWIAVDTTSGRIIALGTADIFLTGDNPHLMWFDVAVLPEFRRQGIGRRLLKRIAEHARTRDRSLLTVECHDQAPGAPAFLKRIGAVQGLAEAINQVRLADVSISLVDKWLELGAGLAAEFEVGLWDTPYPNEKLQDVADLLQEVANDQPRGSLQMEDINYTPELVRGFDQEQLAGGDQRWTLYAVHRATNRLAGLTEVYWNPNRPNLLWQGFTGVATEHRRRGLGRWLKARMLQKLLIERRQVEVIRAGNADSNAPMLKINRALGFNHRVAWVTWQVELQRVEQYLAPGQ